MSEPIVWSGDGRAKVDGIPVLCDRVRVVGLAPVWFVMNGSKHDASVCIEHPHDRDLAARAVVAAVRVLRGETDAAEREKHAELIGLLLQVAPWIGGIPFHPDTVAEVAAAKRRIVEIIEGAPAPREG